MNEITLDGKTYLSSRRAAEVTGYAKDYIGQLCREGRVEARLIGRNWYVLRESVERRHLEDSAASGQADGGTRVLSDSRDIPTVRYEAQENIEFPRITRLGENSDENEPEKKPQWDTWFSERAETSPQVMPEVAPLQELVEEQKEEPAQEVALRRIREYRPTIMPLEAPGGPVATSAGLEREDIEAMIDRTPRIARAWVYPLMQMVSLTVIVAAIACAGIASGFYQSPIFRSQANVLAGVSVYHKE
jgi:hypothetical protein